MSENYLQNYYAYCYVLVQNRSKVFVDSFLDFFLEYDAINSKVDGFPIPQYADVYHTFFSDYKEILDYLEHHPMEEYCLYFSGYNYKKFELRNHISQSDEIGNSAKEIFESHLICVCHYLHSGELVLGISCPTQEPNRMIESYFFNKLKDYSGSTIGYITYEDLPAFDSTTFREIAEKWVMNPNLF